MITNMQSIIPLIVGLVSIVTTMPVLSITWKDYLTTQSKDFKDNLDMINKVVGNHPIVAPQFGALNNEYAKISKSKNIDINTLAATLDNFRFSLYGCDSIDSDCLVSNINQFTNDLRSGKLENSKWHPTKFTPPKPVQTFNSIYDEYYDQLKIKNLENEKVKVADAKASEIASSSPVYICNLGYREAKFQLATDGFSREASLPLNLNSSCYKPELLKVFGNYQYKTDGNKYTWKTDNYQSYAFLKSDPSNSSKPFLYFENTANSNDKGLHVGSCKFIPKCGPNDK